MPYVVPNKTITQYLKQPPLKTLCFSCLYCVSLVFLVIFAISQQGSCLTVNTGSFENLQGCIVFSCVQAVNRFILTLLKKVTTESALKQNTQCEM